MDFNELLMTVFKTPDKIQGLLEKLTGLLICCFKMEQMEQLVVPFKNNKVLSEKLADL